MFSTMITSGFVILVCGMLLIMLLMSESIDKEYMENIEKITDDNEKIIKKAKLNNLKVFRHILIGALLSCIIIWACFAINAMASIKNLQKAKRKVNVISAEYCNADDKIMGNKAYIIITTDDYNKYILTTGSNDKDDVALVNEIMNGQISENHPYEFNKSGAWAYIKQQYVNVDSTNYTN